MAEAVAYAVNTFVLAGEGVLTAFEAWAIAAAVEVVAISAYQPPMRGPSGGAEMPALAPPSPELRL